MEAAIVGALVTVTLPKVIDLICSTSGTLRDRLGSIQIELEIIRAGIGGSRWESKNPSEGRNVLLRELKILAGDIEYTMDSYLAKIISLPRFLMDILQLQKRIEVSSERIRGIIADAPDEVLPTAGRVYRAEEDLLTILLGSQSEMQAKVISVIGFGGPNTDLARRVYEKDEVRRHFSQRAWVSAVDQSVDDVLTEIIGRLEPGPSPSDVKRQLESRLSKERYLIVIDDVRTGEVYNGISQFAWANRVGGKIIVTTDIQPEVRACSCGNAPPPLVPDRSRAGLVLVGESRGMVYEETCKELLAAALARTEGFLDAAQKVCLLYFSMFPRGHDVRRNPLIRRCMAEGILVDAKKNIGGYAYCSDEKIIGQHLDILISHNMIQSIKKSNNGKVKRCQPPGMVFNHICCTALTEHFFTLLCGHNQAETAQPKLVRRLSLHPYLPVPCGGLSVPDLDRLRTMAVFPTVGAQYESILTFDKHKLLRVLDLKECDGLNPEHVVIICQLVLLKYLSLGNTIEYVPRIICRLKCLETLDMTTLKVVTVCTEVLMLPRLKHLLGKFQLASMDCPDENPGMLKKGAKKLLGKKKGFPKKLTHFLTEKSVLQTLSGIFVGNGKGLPQLLRHMLGLRKLKLWCDSTIIGSTDLMDLERDIKEFTNHQSRIPSVEHSLSIDFRGSSPSFLYCLHGPVMLTSLKLCGTVTLSRPVSTQDLISVQELCLVGTNRSGDEIQQALSNLTCRLKFLKLVEKILVGLEIQDNDPFKDLERLCLQGKESLDRIIIQDLNKLVSLHLLCKTLTDLPGIQITNLRNLKEVGLHSEVHDDIKSMWENAAENHTRKPIVVSIKVKPQ